VAGLVGDGPVRGSAQVGVGDEPRPQAVRGVGDGGLDEGVDGLRVQRPVGGAVVPAHPAKDRALDNAGQGYPLLDGGDGAAVVAGGAGQDDELGGFSGLVDFGAGG
jgi:hypothetical protein